MKAAWLVACLVAWEAQALRLPEGTRPMFVPDPVAPADPKTPPGFGCFEACGPSCDCAGRKDGTRVTCEAGERCTWQTIACLTHSFCVWHDGCYLSCDGQFPGVENDGNVERMLCYRACDYSCIDGKEPKAPGGWKVPSPGAPPEKLGALACLKRVLNAPGVPYDGWITYAGLPSCVPDPKCRE